jgi:enoyl-[acyl-carrier protein] reductase III
VIDLRGKAALVTGGSRGIGRACAIRLAEAGADIAINYVSADSTARETAAQVQAIGRKAVVIKADVSESEDVASMMDFVGRSFGRLDILVSNAASGGFRPILETTEAQFSAAMNTNVRALLLLVQRAMPLFAQAGSAKVIALSSHGAHLALPQYGLIGSSKAALESLVRHLALEAGPSGINFNVVQAGFVETDSTRPFMKAPDGEQNGRSNMLRGRPQLAPQDVANTVLFLASSLSDLIQGQTFVVDGGAAIQGAHAV